jgi:hypothetical protein
MRTASLHELIRPAARAAREWLLVRHSFRAEAFVVLTLYAGYEATRGLVVGDSDSAVRHAHGVASLEQSLHVFVERRLQADAHGMPGLVGALGVAYLTLHLAATAVFLLWIYRRRPAAYPLIRTTLLVASALALAGFILYPTAPPRLAGIGIADTISGPHIDLNRGLVSSLYNPFAAIPSMHVGYAVVVGGGLLRYAKRRAARLAGVLYPPFVVLDIVATGNHFLLDAATGAAVAGVALCIALGLSRTARAAAASPRDRRRGRGAGRFRRDPGGAGARRRASHRDPARSPVIARRSDRLGRDRQGAPRRDLGAPLGMNRVGRAGIEPATWD